MRGAWESKACDLIHFKKSGSDGLASDLYNTTVFLLVFATDSQTFLSLLIG